MEKPITTIEALAEMIQRTMASKEDIQGLASRDDIKRVESRLDGIDSQLDHLDTRVGRIEADVHALRDEMVHRREFEDALDRITSIEKKLGLESGV